MNTKHIMLALNNAETHTFENRNELGDFIVLNMISNEEIAFCFEYYIDECGRVVVTCNLVPKRENS